MVKIKYSIQIMSKQECTMFSTRDLNEDCIIISINDSNCNTVIYDNPKIIDVLKLTFDDIETLIDGLVRFSRTHAVQIKEFVDKYKDIVSNIVVHCTAGISRSGAVGCCLARYLNNSDDYLLLTGRYVPNKFVYKNLSKALGLEYSEELFKHKKSLRNKGERIASTKMYQDYGISIDDMFCDVIIEGDRFNE